MTIARSTSKGAGRARGGHPGIDRSDIARPPEAPTGAVVELREGSNRRIRRAAWSTGSLIALRGVPLPFDDDPDTGWLRLCAEAIDRRADRPPCTRLINADADGLPGLVVDRFGPGLSIPALTPAVRAQVVERRGAPADHPTLLTAPETDDLEALFVQLAG